MFEDFNSAPLRSNPTQPTPVEFKYLMIGSKEIVRETNGPRYRFLFLISSWTRRLYRVRGASVVLEAECGSGWDVMEERHVHNWLDGMARFFRLYMHSVSVGKARSIVELRLPLYFLWVFFDCARHLVTCYGGHAQLCRRTCGDGSP